VNALGHGRHQGLAAYSRRHPDNAVNANRQEADDESNSAAKILFHASKSLVQKVKAQWAS
jgi:hypothetical protein